MNTLEKLLLNEEPDFALISDLTSNASGSDLRTLADATYLRIITNNIGSDQSHILYEVATHAELPGSIAADLSQAIDNPDSVVCVAKIIARQRNQFPDLLEKAATALMQYVERVGFWEAGVPSCDETMTTAARALARYNDLRIVKNWLMNLVYCDSDVVRRVGARVVLADKVNVSQIKLPKDEEDLLWPNSN